VDLIHGSNYGISALFGHILPSAWLESTRCEIVNLHPSLLPIGRGADPIPWSIIGKQKQGVTLHIINSGLDTGPILSQKEIPTNIGMNAGEIYETAIEVLYKELENKFYSWINGAVELTEQSNSVSLTRKSQDLESIRVLKPDEIGTFAEFFRKLQALTFSDCRRPLFVDESGRVWKVEVSLTPEILED
jgi:methionyl-tRNA formyltransferase